MRRKKARTREKEERKGVRKTVKGVSRKMLRAEYSQGEQKKGEINCTYENLSL